MFPVFHAFKFIWTAQVYCHKLTFIRHSCVPRVCVRLHRCMYMWVYCVFQKQLFGIEKPVAVELTGWRKYFNSYTLQGRRNVHTHSPVHTQHLGSFKWNVYKVPTGQFTLSCALFSLQCVVVTYSIMVGAAAAYWIHRQSKKETAISSANAWKILPCSNVFVQ